MAAAKPGQALLSAITTEHFVMQGAISSAVSEQQARASMYLYTLSGALVAFGLMAQTAFFNLFVAAILPALFLVGLLTTLRLVDISMESLQSFVTVARIREKYRALDETAATFFDKAHGRWPEGKNDSGHIIGPLLGLLTTAASMIGAVNAFVGAAGLAIILVRLFDGSIALAIIVGGAFALVQIWAIYQDQVRRITMVERSAKQVGLVPGDDGKPRRRRSRRSA